MNEQMRLEDPVAQVQLSPEPRKGLRLQLQQLSCTSSLYTFLGSSGLACCTDCISLVL